MDRRNFLLEMRKQGQLKGEKPCFVMVKYYDSKRRFRGEYVLSLRNDTFYFQKVNRLFEMLRPNDDFELNVKDFIGFKIEALNHRNAFMLYSKDEDVISFEYMVGLRETFSTEENIERICKTLIEKGLKKVEEIE